MNCEECRECLIDYLGGHLATQKDTLSAVEAHLGTCAECARMIEEVGIIPDLLQCDVAALERIEEEAIAAMSNGRSATSFWARLSGSLKRIVSPPKYTWTVMAVGAAVVIMVLVLRSGLPLPVPAEPDAATLLARSVSELPEGLLNPSRVRGAIKLYAPLHVMATLGSDRDDERFGPLWSLLAVMPLDVNGQLPSIATAVILDRKRGLVLSAITCHEPVLLRAVTGVREQDAIRELALDSQWAWLAYPFAWDEASGTCLLAAPGIADDIFANRLSEADFAEPPSGGWEARAAVFQDISGEPFLLQHLITFNDGVGTALVPESQEDLAALPPGAALFDDAGRLAGMRIDGKAAGCQVITTQDIQRIVQGSQNAYAEAIKKLDDEQQHTQDAMRSTGLTSSPVSSAWPGGGKATLWPVNNQDYIIVVALDDSGGVVFALHSAHPRVLRVPVLTAEEYQASDLMERITACWDEIQHNPDGK